MFPTRMTLTPPNGPSFPFRSLASSSSKSREAALIKLHSSTNSTFTCFQRSCAACFMLCTNTLAMPLPLPTPAFERMVAPPWPRLAAVCVLTACHQANITVNAQCQGGTTGATAVNQTSWTDLKMRSDNILLEHRMHNRACSTGCCRCTASSCQCILAWT